MENRLIEYKKALDEKRCITENDVEYWMARDLAGILGYASWDKFENVIAKAEAACVAAGTAKVHHFSRTGNMITAGKGAQIQKTDWFLSRYACYLVAMNADSSKPEVGFAMTYFAVQTRRQELSDEQKRLELRLRILENNHKLAGAAKQAGVVRYPIFQDAGYRGLYGMSLASVKAYKKLDQSKDLLDHAGRLELAANDFRITLTEHRLNRDKVRSESEAIFTHRSVSEEVRGSIVKDNGIAPEDLPIEPSIKPLVQKHRRQLKSRSADASKPAIQNQAY